MTRTAEELAQVSAAIDKEFPHQVGFAIVHGPRGTAHAVVDAESGVPIAWDGWYADPPLDARQLVPIVELDEWTDRDTMLSQAIEWRSAAWLSELAHDLMPHYSFSKLAGEIVRSHWDSEGDVEDSGSVVAYFPTELSRDDARSLMS